MPKKKRLATEAEKRRARATGQTVPTYVYVDAGSSYGSSGTSSCSSHSGSSSSSSSSDSGGGSCDSGGGF